MCKFTPLQDHTGGNISTRSERSIKLFVKLTYVIHISHLISHTNILGDIFNFIFNQICCGKVNIFSLVSADFVHSAIIRLSRISAGNFSQPATL